MLQLCYADEIEYRIKITGYFWQKCHAFFSGWCYWRLMLPLTRGYESFLNSNSLCSPTKCICLLTPVHFHIQWCKPAWIPVSSRLKLFWTDTKKNKMYPSQSVTQKPLSAFCLVPYRKLCAEPGIVSFMRSLCPGMRKGH